MALVFMYLLPPITLNFWVGCFNMVSKSGFALNLFCLRGFLLFNSTCSSQNGLSVGGGAKYPTLFVYASSMDLTFIQSPSTYQLKFFLDWMF